MLWNIKLSMCFHAVPTGRQSRFGMWTQGFASLYPGLSSRSPYGRTQIASVDQGRGGRLKLVPSQVSESRPGAPGTTRAWALPGLRVET